MPADPLPNPAAGEARDADACAYQGQACWPRTAATTACSGINFSFLWGEERFAHNRSTVHPQSLALAWTVALKCLANMALDPAGGAKPTAAQRTAQLGRWIGACAAVPAILLGAGQLSCGVDRQKPGFMVSAASFSPVAILPKCL